MNNKNEQQERQSKELVPSWQHNLRSNPVASTQNQKKMGPKSTNKSINVQPTPTKSRLIGGITTDDNNLDFDTKIKQKTQTTSAKSCTKRKTSWSQQPSEDLNETYNGKAAE